VPQSQIRSESTAAWRPMVRRKAAQGLWQMQARKACKERQRFAIEMIGERPSLATKQKVALRTHMLGIS
jgi:hypothetical protein